MWSACSSEEESEEEGEGREGEGEGGEGERKDSAAAMDTAPSGNAATHQYAVVLSNQFLEQLVPRQPL